MSRPINEMMNDHKVRGFTLIELMITIAIIGVLASVALPSYSSFIATQRIKTASFDLMSMMIFTRSEAIKRNTTVTLNFDSATNAFTVVTGATELRRQAGFKGITLVCKNVTGTTGVVTACPSGGIIYNSNGRLVTPFLPMELSNTTATTSAFSRCITIDLSGRPNSKKGGC